MNDTMILTPRVDSSRLPSGQIVYVASFDELPGVVCEGETQEAAMGELYASIDSIKGRMGLQAVGLKTKLSDQWQWESFAGADRVMCFGSHSDTRLPETNLPRGFRELQPFG